MLRAATHLRRSSSRASLVLARRRPHALLSASSSPSLVAAASLPRAFASLTTAADDDAGASSTHAPPAASATTPPVTNTPTLGSMNVTRHNFEANFADLKRDMELPSCRFIAIDTEFTGLSPNEDEKERFLDTLEERYQKVKRAGESFLITQFGLSTIHIDAQTHVRHIKTWNFYIFPRANAQSDHRFLCQASSLQFLSSHGFDFNKFISDGIPFVNLAKTKVLAKRLEKRIEMLMKPPKNTTLTLSDEGIVFQADVNQQLDEWIADGAKKGSKLVIPTRNSFFSMIVHETVRLKASYLYAESTNGGIEVSFVSQKIKQELIAAKIQAMRTEFDESIGFSRVIDAISQSKKPVIGHNALLDFVYVFNQFYKPLPATLSAFKRELLELFPTIYDTKHVALRSAVGSKLPSTGLATLFEYMAEHVTPAPVALLSSDARFDGYRAALQAEGDSDEKLLCHEAGFDAFMTGVCFLGLLAHDADGNVVVGETSSSSVTNQLAQLAPLENQLNLMISDEKSLDLRNLHQTIDRTRVFRVSSTKRKLHHVRMDAVFPTAKIQRVVRESDQHAFVVLAADDLVENDATETDAEAFADLTITPYDAFIAAQTQKAKDDKDTANQKLYERLHAEYAPMNDQIDDSKSTSRGTFPVLAPPSTPDAAAADASPWHRCTIS